MQLLDRIFGPWRRRGESGHPRRRSGRARARLEGLEPREMPATFIAFPVDPPPAQAPARSVTVSSAPAPAATPTTATSDAHAEAIRQAIDALNRAAEALGSQASQQASAAVDRAIESGLTIARQATDAGLQTVAASAGSDEVTGLARPTFRGTARPGATVALYARRDGQADAVPIGRTVANRTDGSWSLLSNRRLADGPYTILGTQTDARGVEGPREPRARISIDTAGPRVVGLEFDPNARVATLAIQDVGLGLGAPPEEAVRVTRADTNTLVPATVSIPTTYRGSTQAQTLTVVIQDDWPMPTQGYQIEVVSARLTDLALNPLDGEFRNGFPTGDARPGGDFRARLYPFRVRPLSVGR